MSEQPHEHPASDPPSSAHIDTGDHLLKTLIDDGEPDTLTELLAKQAEELSHSRWHATIAGVPHELAWRIHTRLEELQRERPLSGMYLRARCGGVKTTVIHEIVGNRKWGRSRHASRGHASRKKRRIYNPYNQALLIKQKTQAEPQA